MVDDPTTGFTRRAMLQMPWIQYQPPINYKNLPDLDNFIAGISSSTKNRLNNIKLKNHLNTLSNNRFNIFYIIFIVLIIFIILLVVFIK